MYPEKMNLVAPADLFETALRVIDAGTEEIYLGLVNQKIIDFAHKNGVKVDYAVKMPFLNDLSSSDIPSDPVESLLNWSENC